MLCSEPIQRKPQRGAAKSRTPLWRRPKAASFALALNKAHVLALNTAHVLRLNEADVLALNKAHVLRLNNKICPVFRANTKEAACKAAFFDFSGTSRAEPYFLRPYLEGDVSERASQSSFLVEFMCPGDHVGFHFGHFGSPGPHPKRAQGPQNVRFSCPSGTKHHFGTLPGFRGSRGSRRSDVVNCCSEPPFPTRGGQDDGSYTNSLKLGCLVCWAQGL